MFINPFVAGILVTVLVESIIVIVGAIIVNHKKRK